MRAIPDFVRTGLRVAWLVKLTGARQIIGRQFSANDCSARETFPIRSARQTSRVSLRWTTTGSGRPVRRTEQVRKEINVMGLILLIILILFVIGAVPAWPYSRSWGYWPSGGLGLILLIVLILLLIGRI